MLSSCTLLTWSAGVKWRQVIAVVIFAMSFVYTEMTL